MGIPVVVDCDLTLGGRGVGGGLSLMSLLGSRAVDLLGVTTTFGAAPVDVVYRDARRLLWLLGREEIPVFHGAPWPGYRATEAAHFLSRAARERAGELIVVSTGPLANLRAAAEVSRGFFADLGKVICCGGVLGKVRLGWGRIRDGAFSPDPESAHAVLSSRRPVTVLTAELAAQALFGWGDFAVARSWPAWARRAVTGCLRAATLRTASLRQPLWEVLPAAYLGRPELFEDRSRYCISTVDELARGTFALADRALGTLVNVPVRIRDASALRAHVLASVSAALEKATRG